MRKRSIVFFTGLILCAAFSWLSHSFAKDELNTKDDIYKELEIFAEALAVIDKKYVEDKDAEELVYGAMKGMLAALDSYSQFLTPDDYRNLLVETEGKFGGLGIEITIKDGVLTIISPIEDTPAWQAGVKAGDIIVKIDGELTKDITLDQAVKKLRGDPGSKVTITIFREKDRKVIDTVITRGIIKIKDIKRALILDDEIAYVKIAEFRESTSKDLLKAMALLDKEGMKALILDVRNNPGGLLDSAINVSSTFVPDGKVIVSTKSRTESERVYESVHLRKKYTDIPIVVLINKGSASGSEILASSLRDNGQAILLGSTTFGKGSVQTIVPLSDTSALRLTTSKYYTPKGISIHEKGVVPDIELDNDVAITQKEDVFEEIEIEEKKGFDYKDDCQIVRAFDFIKGIMILENIKANSAVVGAGFTRP